MYPQTVVPLTSDIHNHLRDNHAGQTEGVKLLDGVYYTANIDGNNTWNPTNENTWEKNPVYQYGSDRYVRVTPYSSEQYREDMYPQYTYNNGEPLERVTAAAGDAGHLLRWFKIEPIKWIIINPNGRVTCEDKDNAGLGFITDLDVVTVLQGATLELYAADVLVGGIPFGVEGHTSWDGSLINQYLNNDFYNQAFSKDEVKLIQQSTIYNNRALGESKVSETDPKYNLSPTHCPEGGLNETIQKIYLLSMYELSNDDSPYVGTNKIFEPGNVASSTRQAHGTDYARAHNLAIGSTGFTFYWTRTAANSTYVYRVSSTGTIGGNVASAANNGQRPALQLKLNNLVYPYSNKKAQLHLSNQAHYYYTTSIFSISLIIR